MATRTTHASAKTEAAAEDLAKSAADKPGELRAGVEEHCEAPPLVVGLTVRRPR